jgi:hypothetical protein
MVVAHTNDPGVGATRPIFNFRIHISYRAVYLHAILICSFLKTFKDSLWDYHARNEFSVFRYHYGENNEILLAAIFCCDYMHCVIGIEACNTIRS